MKAAPLCPLLACLSIALIVCPAMGQGQASVLARVEAIDRVDHLGLPVYAHLLDASGQAYALVVATEAELEQAGWPFDVLAVDPDVAALSIAIERLPGALARGRKQIDVLYDDGCRLIVTPTPEQKAELIGMGLAIIRISTQMVWPSDPAGWSSLRARRAIIANPTISNMMYQVHQVTVSNRTAELDGETPAMIGSESYTILTRGTSSGTPIRKASQFVYEQMQAVGLEVSYQSWSNGIYNGQNVVGVKQGTTLSNEVVLVTAHIDSMPNDGTRSPGADDNASGCVGVMLAASVLKGCPTERTIRFICFGGEEQGLLGSEAYAQSIQNAGETNVTVFNMDMIAYSTIASRELRLHTRLATAPGYATDMAVATTFQNVLSIYGLDGRLTPAIQSDGIEWSDHYSFWQKGYTGVLVIECVTNFNPNYHMNSDVMANINMEYFTDFIRASVGTVAHLAGVTATPAPTSNGWLTIQVTPVSGTWQLTAPAGYTGPMAGTGSLAAVSAVTGAYGIAWGPMTGYVASTNQFQFVTGGSTSLFAGVYLLISTNIGTPAGVVATEGTYTNWIRISWQGVEGATGYEIWRSLTNNSDTARRIASIAAAQSTKGLPTVAAGAKVGQRSEVNDQPTAYSLQSTAYYFDDYDVVPILSYYYWIRAKTAMIISPMSYVGMGYASLSPEQSTGTADITVTDLVYLPVNATNLSPAGTVSCWAQNYGPDALNAASVAFDFHMGTNADAMVWIGSAQSNITLSVGGEILIILTPSEKRGLTVRGDLSGIQQVKVVVRHLSALNDPNLANNTTTGPGTIIIKTSGVNSLGRSLNDYDGDGKSDVTVYATNALCVLLSGKRYKDPIVVEPGQTDWVAAPGDYEGAGRTGVGVYVPAYGFLYTWFSSDGGHGEWFFLGGPDYTITPCDFDGDAKTDPMVYRETDGYVQGLASTKQYALCEIFLNVAGYQPVRGDFDGDGLDDPAAYNRSTGRWVIDLSGSGYQVVAGMFGGPGYLSATADFDGDGKTDPAVYAPDTAYWQVLFSSSLETQGYYAWWGGVLGSLGGLPVPADYDGDGRTDPALYHQDTGLWEAFPSTQGYQLAWVIFGGPAYKPVLE